MAGRAGATATATADSDVERGAAMAGEGDRSRRGANGAPGGGGTGAAGIAGSGGSALVGALLRHAGIDGIAECDDDGESGMKPESPPVSSSDA